jgi:O-antigen/teichoic acid export membrane protein
LVPSTIQSRDAQEAESGTRPGALKTWVSVRLSPLFGRAEVDAEASRSRDRYRRAALTGATSILAKVVVLATTIISVPLTFRYLGLDRYGLWMTISSFVLFLGFADLGVGNGLVAAISKANGEDDKLLAQRQVSCAFILLCVLASAILCLLAATYHLIPWAKFYGTSTALAGREAGPATAILIACTALSMPLGTVLRVQLGYQQGFVGDLWNAAGNALALAGIIVVTHLGGGLPQLVLAVAGIPVLATAANWSFQFFHTRPWLRPRLSLYSPGAAMQLAAVGGLFFVQQCFGLLYYVSDNIVIARTMGASDVARYAVMQRIFSIGLVAQYFMIPLWPAIGEAIARRDFSWAHRIVRRAITISLLLGSGCAVVLLCASRWIMRHFSGVDVGSIDLLRVGFAFWVILVGYIAAMNAILNQPGVMVRHLKLFGAGSIVSLALKIEFARHGSLTGVIWGTVLGFGIVYVIPATRLAFRSVSAAAGGVNVQP